MSDWRDKLPGYDPTQPSPISPATVERLRKAIDDETPDESGWEEALPEIAPLGEGQTEIVVFPGGSQSDRDREQDTPEPEPAPHP